MISQFKIIKLIFIIVLVSFTGCKDQQPNAKETMEDKQTKNKNDYDLKLFFDGVFSNDDEVILHYEDIEGMDSIRKSLKGMPNNWQRVAYRFPEEIIPYGFSLTFSEESTNKIKFDKIVLNRRDDRIIIKDSALLVYFKLKNLQYRFEENELILEKLANNERAEIISKENLNNRIENRYIQN
jgi:hypothetical protein